MEAGEVQRKLRGSSLKSQPSLWSRLRFALWWINSAYVSPSRLEFFEGAKTNFVIGIRWRVCHQARSYFAFNPTSVMMIISTEEARQMIHVDPAHLVASELVIIAKFTFEVDPYWLVIGRCISSLVYYLLTLCRRRRQADFKTKSLPIRETKIKSFASYLHNEPISCVGLWSTTELA